MLQRLRTIWTIRQPTPEDVNRFEFVSAEQRSLGHHARIAVFAVAVGALAGGAGILFRLAIEGFQFGAFGFQSGSLLEIARTLPWWHVLLAPALGGLVIGWFVQTFMHESRLHGIPDVIIASLIHQGRLPPRAAFGAALVSAASVGVGASVGREGPMVHLAASIGSWLAQRLGLTSYDTQTLLACGVAAGVATSFNVPIGGTVFAFELLAIRYSLQRLAPVAIAAVVGTALNRAYYGDFPAWLVPDQIFVSLWEFPAFALLGVVCACSAFVLIRSIMTVRFVMWQSPVAPMLRPAIGGLGVGAIAVFFPHVLGIGYETTDLALKELLPLSLLAALVFAKIAATALSLGSGFGGGIFTPSIVLGAMTGGTFGVLATAMFPDMSSGVDAYTIIGIAAVSGAARGVPFASIIVIFEMTGSYPLALGVMLAVVIASIVLNDVLRTDFFGWQLAQRGVDRNAITPHAMLNDITVESILRRDAPSVPTTASADDIRSVLDDSASDKVYVVDSDGALVGQISAGQLLRAGTGPDFKPDDVRAASVAGPDPRFIERGVDAGAAWNLMNEHNTEDLPVVQDQASMRFVGHVTRADLLVAYHRTLVNKC